MYQERVMEDKEEKKYWMKVNTVTWVIILVISFFILFPGFVALLVIWAVGKIKVIDKIT